MLTIERILFPTDFSEGSERALDAALSLAETFDAELHMLHAVVLHSDDPNDPAHHFPDSEEIRVRLRQAAERRIASGGDARSAQMLRVRHHQLRGMSPAPVIREQAEEVDADLIVMSTAGRRGLEGVLVGSVAEEVVRLAPCPVLTLRSGVEAASFPSAAPILVPVDFSEHSRRALTLAREFADRFSAGIQVLHVFERPIHPEVYLGGMPLDSPQFRTVENSLREALETFVSEAPGPEVLTELYVVDGRAVPGILEFAEHHGTGMIVIATHGLTGLAHVLLGSVSERIVRRAECPVLTARAFGTEPVSGSEAAGREA
jgi:nucleotide-binding universal stress UspA family protein